MTAFSKDEIILLYIALFHLKRFFEEAGITSKFFEEYENLKITPNEVYRKKENMKRL